ncbi:MAG: NAD-dependent succinate-semialdehyde dehydrogenase [Actinomycetaceae bacterium]|nr:NAD-dependent succinate-semialdehyde dehydrogenase [Actinomycetaceae bacterium]
MTQEATQELAYSYIEQLDPVHGLFIDGNYLASASGDTFDVHDPATTRTICAMPSATEEQVDHAVDAAAKALPSWRKVAPRQRSEILRRAFELMLEQHHELAALMSLENGKSIADSYAEVTYAAEFFRWFSEEAVRSDGDYCQSPAGGTRTIVTRQPIGVAALITPWNFPAAMATRKIGPALAAGCTVVLKPASETPITALAVCRILEQAGVPKGVVNMVTSSSSSMVSQRWLEDPRVRMVSFTGSTRVGSLLMGLAAKRIVTSSMELGGNASFIIGKNADIEAAVEGAMIAKYRNAGQACTAANRFFVHKDVVDEFVDAFGQKIKALSVGPAFSGADIGPMVNKKAQETITALLEEAIANGAHILAQSGDIPDEGYFVRPTLLQVDSAQARVMQEEIFGPIAPIVTFDDDETMIQQANSVEMGLASYVFDEDIKWALTVAESLETGMIGVNRGAISDPATPFGGFKQSGIGREGAREGLREFQETQYFSVAWK